MVVEDQFGVGDIVDLGEANGTVEKITLRATRVRDVQGTVWHVPNGEILRVANKSQEWAARPARRRGRLRHGPMRTPRR